VVLDAAWPSENAARLPPSLAVAAGNAAGLGQGGAGGGFEDLTDALASLGRAFDVAGGADALAHLLALGLLETAHHRCKARTCSGETGFWLVLWSSSMVLASNRRSFLQPTRMMGRPEQKCSTSEIHWETSVACGQGKSETNLLLHVVQGVGRVDGEADEDDVRIGVGERAKSVVVFLASGVPQGQLDVLAVDLDIRHVVLEDGGNVDLTS
jgi:hypothetical protein